MSNVEAPIPVVASTSYRQMNRGFTLPTCHDLVQER